jgi:hypothetical protein
MMTSMFEIHGENDSPNDLWIQQEKMKGLPTQRRRSAMAQTARGVAALITAI